MSDQPCPYVTGNVTKYCTLTPPTLTDAEREAVEVALVWVNPERQSTLRGLLDRLSPIKTAESDRPQAIATPEPCSVPPEWTSRPHWVDPPSGHRYGFPRLYDPQADGDMVEWLIRNGYPEQLAHKGVVCTFTATAETVEE